MPDLFRRGKPAAPPAVTEETTRRATPERILQRIDWQVIRHLDGLLQGDYRSLFYGYGVDFADLREYQPEDDIRYIDWNVTARMDAPYVRQYMEDREVTAWFLVDFSPSMDFGGMVTDKRAVTIDLVAVLARLLTRHGNRIGAVIYTGQSGVPGGAGTINQRIERVIPARGGRNQVLLMINELLKQPRLSRAPYTDLHAMLNGAMQAIRKRSLIFILSDFFSAPGWEHTLSLMKQRHEVLAVRLWDPREMDLPDLGPIWMEDAETGEQVYVDTHDPRFREKFAEITRQRSAELAAAFRHAGVEPWSLSTDEDLVKAIMRFAGARKQLHRGRAGAGLGAPR